DLRTPLARLRLEVEMLDGKVAGESQRGMVSDLVDDRVHVVQVAHHVAGESQRGMVSDLDDMNAIIDQFIDFTRSEAAEPLAPVDLNEVARASAEGAMRAGAQVELR